MAIFILIWNMIIEGYPGETNVGVFSSLDGNAFGPERLMPTQRPRRKVNLSMTLIYMVLPKMIQHGQLMSP